ncbi:angiotensin-converting enzyme-like [Epargyreus clarus]|uniref:angiotensin-converting enzyme-like n=1 Tax=Epargyreus clarus TaxID=520877 RepID=UPI003C2D059E
MLLITLLCVILAINRSSSVQFLTNPTSEMSTDDKNVKWNKTADQSDESGHEVETDVEEVKEKKFLDDAMRTVLDPSVVIVKSEDVVENIKIQLEELDKENSTLEAFMDEMDKLSLEVCKTSSEALWSYVTDINNESKKNAMMRIAAEEDETKKQYWNLLKQKYLNDIRNENDLRMNRKIRIIKARGTNVQMPQSKQREEIDTMQRIWSRVSVCAYNATDCNTEHSRTMNDIISVFKTSNNSNELAYYWKAYRDGTGKKIRPIFKDYVARMNNVAKEENFTDAGEMWRYAFEDEDFVKTVDRVWSEIKPLYELLHDYVRSKLKAFYAEELKEDKEIPAHILGNLWAQEWQPIYPKVAPYPDVPRPSVVENGTLDSMDLFDSVDEFHQSLGFQSAKESYQDIKKTMATANCLPSSHDMCDGVNYKIKWCGEKVTDVTVGLSRAARLLSHVQYFKHYSNLPPLFRDGPIPAFHDAISDIAAVQLTSPTQMQTLNFTLVATGDKATMNHLLWLALEKLPLMAYAYVLDKWRWEVFANSSLQNWNEYWWQLRTKETGVTPPVPRNESDLDPAAKYHVASHVQYITYLVSPILEFQILQALCEKINHTGPLHECSIRGQKEAGKLLSDGMALGASEDWRSVLHTMTGENELSTRGILEYFAALKDFLSSENAKLEKRIDEDMDKSAPIIVGVIVVILTFLMLLLYCVRKRNVANRVLAVCGLRQNGSLDIVTNEMSQGKTNETIGVREDKV